MEYVKQVMVSVCLFFTNTYLIWFIKWPIQFNTNAVIENHIQNYKSVITNNVQLYDINNHYDFSQSLIFIPSNLSKNYIFI